MLRDCSLDHKITLKEFRQSLKCFEEGGVSTSSFDDLADRGSDKEEEEWSLRTFSGPLRSALCHHPHDVEQSQ